MAQSQNTHLRDLFDGTLIYPTDQTGVKVVNQGDLVVWDTTLNSALGGIRSVQAGTDLTASNFAGIARQNSIINSLNDVQLTIEVGFKNIYNMQTVAGDVIKHGAPLYLYDSAGVITNAQTVTVTAPGDDSHIVGYAILPQDFIMNGVLSITGAVGTLVPMAVVATFPVASIA